MRTVTIRVSPIVTLVAWSALVAPPIAAAPGLIHIPVRWCAVEGSSAAEAPECVCEDSTKLVLWRRHERPSEAVYIPDCNVTWRSAAMMQQPAFPVIADPCDPMIDGSCAGQTGDINLSGDNDDLTELNQAFVACYNAWDAMDVGAVGVVGVNVRRFVEDDGSVNLLAGYAGIPEFGDAASQLVNGAFSVIDNDYTWSPSCATPPTCAAEVAQLDGDPTDQEMGHEGGHSISLTHMSPPPDNLMEPQLPAADALTTGGSGQNSTVCPNPLPMPTSQCGQVRLQALCAIPGTVVSVPFRGTSTPAGPVSDEHPLTIGDVPVGEVDLGMVGLVNDPATGAASFVWRTSEPFPDVVRDLTYEFAIDVDDDPSTGGAPASVGLGLTLGGVELAGRVTVEVARPSPTAPKIFTSVGRLWIHDAGGLIEVADLATEAADLQGVFDYIIDPPNDPTAFAAGGMVAQLFDGTLLGPASRLVFQALAIDSAGIGETTTPAVLYVKRPELPVCTVAPETVEPGGVVTVSASGMTPNQTTSVLFGATEVATGATDASGFTQTTFNLPPAAAGDHLITIGADDPDDAITADCTVTVLSSDAPGDAGTLRLRKAGAALDLQWTGSGKACAASDYAVFEGSIRALRSTGYDHDPLTCSTAGATDLSIESSGPADRYFLVVSLSSSAEGSYGQASDGGERPASTNPCIPAQDVGVCF